MLILIIGYFFISAYSFFLKLPFCCTRVKNNVVAECLSCLEDIFFMCQECGCLTRSPRGLLHLPWLKDVPPNYDRGVAGRGAESISFTHCGEKKSQETVLEECSSLNFCGWMEAGEMSGKKMIVVDLGERLVWHYLWDFLWFVESYIWTFLSNSGRCSGGDRKLVRLTYCLQY